MITYKIASPTDDMDVLMSLRLTMLKEVNGMDTDRFPTALEAESRAYFANGEATTALAFDGNTAIGCATLSYIYIMPTYSHPTGKRAHLMNVYTKAEYRHRGIAKKLCVMLIEEAQKRGITEISLDATESGRPLYRALGFTPSQECMVLTLENRA